MQNHIWHTIIESRYKFDSIYIKLAHNVFHTIIRYLFNFWVFMWYVFGLEYKMEDLKPENSNQIQCNAWKKIHISKCRHKNHDTHTDNYNTFIYSQLSIIIIYRVYFVIYTFIIYVYCCRCYCCFCYSYIWNDMH